MQRQSHLVKTVLEQWDARNKTFIVVIDSPGKSVKSLA